MLPLSARSGLSGGPQPAQGRLLVLGMAISLVSASLGYAANNGGRLSNTAASSTGESGGTNSLSQSGSNPGTGSAGAGGAGSGSTSTGAAGSTQAGSSGLAGSPASQGGQRGTTPGTGAGGGVGGAAAGGQGQPGAAGGANAGSTGSTGCSDGKYTCGARGSSDNGVTATSIKLGFLAPNTSQLTGAGINVGVSGDQPKIVTAWTNELNRLKVNGRTVSVYSQSFDVTSVQDMQAACKTMTQDQKVFSVLTPGGYDSVAQLCVAKENKTPLIGTDPEPAQWYQDSAPNLYSTFMNKDRIMQNNAQWLKVGGYLKPTDKVGFIYHDIPNVAPSVEKTYLPALRANGINPVSIVKLSTDSNAGLSEIQQAVLTMKKAGVTFVIPVMNLIYKAAYQKDANSAQFNPKYDESDVYFGCSEFTTTAYDTSGQFNHTQCQTTTDTTQYTKTLTKPSAWTAYADAVYKRSFPEGYAGAGSSQSAQDGQRELNYSIGSIFMLWYHAAEKAGTNLTRPLWGKAMQQTGTVTQQLGYCSMSFGPGKFDGSDNLSISEYFHEASDGYPADRFHTIKPCYPKYF